MVCEIVFILPGAVERLEVSTGCIVELGSLSRYYNSLLKVTDGMEKMHVYKTIQKFWECLSAYDLNFFSP